MPQSGEHLDVLSRIHSSREHNLLEEVRGDMVGATESKEESILLQEAKGVKIEILVPSRG